jgi:hypothetical protein
VNTAASSTNPLDVAVVRFDGQDGFVEIGLVSQESADLPSHGDGYLTIRVSSEGFAGHGDLWVSSRVLRSFCEALVSLERNRSGEALIESMSPNELRLVVRSVGSRGHMAVEGTTGRQVHRENTRVWHSVTFGFEFDPSQLKTAANVDWIKRNADRGTPDEKGVNKNSS